MTRFNSLNRSKKGRFIAIKKNPEFPNLDDCDDETLLKDFEKDSKKKEKGVKQNGIQH